MVKVQAFDEPEFNLSEILRYAGGGDEEYTKALLSEALRLCLGVFDYRVCYDSFPVSISGDTVDLGFTRVKSRALLKNLDGCDRIVLFAATAGAEIDRLIMRFSHTNPSRALMLQAIGAERIEALCNSFTEYVKKEYNGFSRPRFSPGYADFPLEYQRDIFSTLDCSRKIGLSLNESLLMSPSKSVTAIIGISKHCSNNISSCKSCNQKDCIYKKEE